MKYLIAASVLMAGLTAVQAQDSTDRWTGPYVGVQTGKWFNITGTGRNRTDLLAGWTFALGQSRFVAGAEIAVGSYHDFGF